MAENFDTEATEEETTSEVTEDTESTEIPVEDGDEEAESASSEEETNADAIEDAASEDEEEASDEDGAAVDGEEKKGFFKKKKDKRDEQIADLTDRIKRQMAEFENFRKRSDKEKSQMYDMGARSILEKILPVVDNFERGLAGLDEEAADPFADGMKMVYKQLMTTLEEAGVKPIEAVGAEFDPEYHNAVMHVDDDAYGENEIVEEMQKGYIYHDNVIRFSMVKVAN